MVLQATVRLISFPPARRGMAAASGAAACRPFVAGLKHPKERHRPYHPAAIDGDDSNLQRFASSLLLVVELSRTTSRRVTDAVPPSPRGA